MNEQSINMNCTLAQRATNYPPLKKHIKIKMKNQKKTNAQQRVK